MLKNSGNSSALLVDGEIPQNGFLVLRNSDENQWVCRDGFTPRTADVICRELGYPGIRKVSYINVIGHPAQRSWIVAPTCSAFTDRLDDCSWSNGTCSSEEAVELTCHDPALLGCYRWHTWSLLRGRPGSRTSFEVNSTGECLYQCKVVEESCFAVLQGSRCHCTNLGYVMVEMFCFPHLANNACSRQEETALVYSTSIGFCSHPGSIEHAQLDSNLTSFGSILNIVCDDGYVINGSQAIQCVPSPGGSTYVPTWNASIPACVSIDISDTTREHDDIRITQRALTSLNVPSFLPAIEEKSTTSPERWSQLSILLTCVTWMLSLLLVLSVVSNVRAFIAQVKDERSAQITHTYMDSQALHTSLNRTTEGSSDNNHCLYMDIDGNEDQPPIKSQSDNHGARDADGFAVAGGAVCKHNGIISKPEITCISPLIPELMEHNCEIDEEGYLVSIKKRIELNDCKTHCNTLQRGVQFAPVGVGSDLDEDGYLVPNLRID